MVRELFPDADREFADSAKMFADVVSRDPEVYLLSADDARRITHVVQQYRDALARALRRHTRTQVAIGEKDRARAQAEAILRRYANIIRASDRIDAATKQRALVFERPKRLRKRGCPQSPPHLRFLRSEDGTHVLEFRAAWGAKSRAKPRGAVRLELFVDLVPVGEQPPATPGLPGARPAGTSGGPWYLRSCTTNPIRVTHPLPGAPAEPRLVVYWVRWAGASGEVGPWSRAVVARVEGGGPAAMRMDQPGSGSDESGALKLAA